MKSRNPSGKQLSNKPLSTSALARPRHISTDSSTFKATSLDPATGREIVSYLGTGLNALVFYQTLVSGAASVISSIRHVDWSGMCLRCLEGCAAGFYLVHSARWWVNAC